jgi:hypothetical protein
MRVIHWSCLISLRSGRPLDKDGQRRHQRGGGAGRKGVAMRRVMAIVTGIVLLGLLAGMTVVSAERRAKNDWGLPIETSGGNSASSAVDDDGDERIVVVSRNATETMIDNPPEGDSQGDEDVVTSPLFKRGKRVGRLDVHAVFTEVAEEGTFAFQVTFTATLQGGSIVSTGVGVFDEPTDNSFTAAITGGTGRYDEAGGDVVVTFVSDEAVRFAYDLEDLD